MKHPFLPAVLLALGFASCMPSDRKEGSDPRAAEASYSSQPVRAADCINLNKATAEQLMALPGIGEVAARKIVEHREQNGPFRRPEHLIIVDGLSERKYRALAGLVCVE